MSETTAGRRVLLAGHRAYSARGLRELLCRQGHEVVGFSRGPVERQDFTATGPVDGLDRHPRLRETFDTLINFVVLRFESRHRNLAYLDAVLRFCRSHRVGHLIHISSMSVYRDSVRLVTERAATQPAPAGSATYAAIKLAGETRLRDNLPAGTRLTLIRPACILSADMPHPLGSVGERLASGKVLVLGRPSRQRPVIGRSVLQRALGRLVSSPPVGSHEVLLFVDRNSPTCMEYLQACCELLGSGTGAVSRPAPVWIARLLLRELRRGGRPPRQAVARGLSTVRQRWTGQRYDPRWTEERLGMPLATRWLDELAGASDHQIAAGSTGCRRAAES